jgi:hypothetical protein
MERNIVIKLAASRQNEVRSYGRNICQGQENMNECFFISWRHTKVHNQQFFSSLFEWDAYMVQNYFIFALCDTENVCALKLIK